MAGVRHLVFTSVASADKRTGIPHFDSKARVEDFARPLDSLGLKPAEGFDDPKVEGVTCFLSKARTGGIKGSLGLAEDTWALNEGVIDGWHVAAAGGWPAFA